MKLPNGYGSVHKLSGNRRKPYRARVTDGWDPDGKQIYLTIGYFETRQDALKALGLYHDNPFHIETRHITLKQVYDMWWKEKETKVSDASIKTYTWAWKQCKNLHDIPFNNIRLISLQEIVDSMGTKWASKKKFKILFNQLYDFAIANDISSKKYSQYIDLGKKTTSNIHKPFTLNEIEMLWKNIDRLEYIDVVLIYIYTGFRPSELLDIECEKGVNINEWYLQGGAKTEAGKDRIVPIHPRIRPIIKKWYDKGHKFLITNSNNEQMKYRNWRDEKFNHIMEQLGLDHKPHDTRHTFSTNLSNVEANKVCIQRLMGHASKDVTDKVYTHKDIEELRKAINLLP